MSNDLPILCRRIDSYRHYWWPRVKESGMTRWIIIACIALGLFVATFTYGAHKGSQVARARQAKAEVKAAQESAHRVRIRQQIHDHLDLQPLSPIQRVGDAMSDSAAGKLRAWARD